VERMPLSLYVAPTNHVLCHLATNNTAHDAGNRESVDNSIQEYGAALDRVGPRYYVYGERINVSHLSTPRSFNLRVPGIHRDHMAIGKHISSIRTLLRSEKAIGEPWLSSKSPS